MSATQSETAETLRPLPGIAELFYACLRVGVLSFGGPAAQIALMHREFVDRHGWLGEKQYLNALSFCMLLPGPEAMQLAIYVGWRLRGVIGGLIAGLLFVMPGALVILLLASLYAWYGDVPLVNALFLGIKAAVIVIVIEALLKVAKRALHQPVHWLIAIAAFIGIFFLALPFPLIIATAAAVGFLMTRHSQATGDVDKPRLSVARSLFTILVWLVIWWLPIIALLWFGDDRLLFEIGLFFSKLAVVTFGGAYAVLAYLGQDVVGHYGWLTAGEMMDGLGLAETTPGPLILVNEFVGFLAAFRQQGFAHGLLGAAVALWATFAPCFLWIFAGAPYIDWISAQPRLQAALTAITAAVVGVILNLSIWFALHVFFNQVDRVDSGWLVLWLPEFDTLDWRVAVLSVLAAALMFKWHWGVSRVLALCALSALVLSGFQA